MGILGIIQLGVMSLGHAGLLAAAFEAPPHVPERIEEAARPRDAGLALASWSQRDGLVAGPDYLVTTASGILMFAAQDRIYRFDGSRFSVVEDSAGVPLSLEAVMGAERASDDSVWFRTRNGQAARIGPRDVLSYGEESGLTRNSDIKRVLVDGAETVAATSIGLYRLRAGRWIPIPLEGTVGRKVFSLAFDGRRWWAIVESQLVVIERDFSAMQVVRDLEPEIYSGLAGGADRGIWYWQTSGERNLCRLDADVACYRIERLAVPAVDAHGGVHWVDGTRVLRLDRTAGAPQRDGRPAGRVSTVDTGLPLDEVHAADDGALWFIAGGHIARLAPTPVEALPVPAGAVVPAAGGDVWVGAWGVGMVRVGRPPPGAPLFVNEEGYIRVGPWPAQAGRSSRRLSALAAEAETRPVLLEDVGGVPDMIVRVDPLGDGRVMAASLTTSALWIGDAAGTWREHPAPPLDKGSVVRGIARDRAGQLIVGAMRDRAGLYRFDGTRWEAMPSRGEGLDDVVAMHVDSRDRIWIGNRGSMIRVDSGIATVYDADEGLDVGAIRAIQEVDGQIWAVGHKGLARFTDDGFDMLRFDERLPVSGMTGFAFDDDGTLWMGAAQGIVRVPRKEWSAAIGQSGRRARWTLLGEPEGVGHPIVHTAPLPSVSRTRDGRLWFFTIGGVYRLDPRRMPAPRPAPTLAISSMAVDGTRQVPGEAVRLPSGARRLVFAFHTLSPVVPERTAFRYRIAGLDGDWTLVDGREVVIDRLPPGNYRFELQASAEDGDWNSEIAAQAFMLPPTFWQSIWSKVLLALAVSGLTAFLFMLRVRQLDARRRAVAEAKSREREKIARDMHDTLLQGVNGLLMTMHAAVARMDVQSAERSRLEDSICIAERVLEEGRDRVSALRSTQPHALGLVQALQIHARDLAHERRILCEVQVLGEAQPLVAAIEDEVLQIGREALNNAFLHARAGCIGLTIAYEATELRVEVRDDGIGLQAPAAGREHWGIQGMRERAAAIQGRLGIASTAQRGTRVTMIVPAHVAYLRQGHAEGGQRWRSFVARLRDALGRRRSAGSPS